MDYEKMYKEALEKARKRVATEPQDHTDAILKDIFPELRESEDERIIKTIRQLLETARDAHSNTSLAKPFIDALAWLEKQKEQKPADNPKYAELTWKDINELERIINNVHYEFQNGIGEDSFGELVLERFREYKDDGSMDEQKPTSISCGHENDAEWSEEDEEKIVTISEIIEHCTTIPYSGGTLTLNKEYKKELLCFIRTLRPSWKPSEEQIKALDKAIPVCMGVVGRDEITPLESLLQDLKKLM